MVFLNLRRHSPNILNGLGLDSPKILVVFVVVGGGVPGPK
jgi:hypothetical protein